MRVIWLHRDHGSATPISLHSRLSRASGVPGALGYLCFKSSVRRDSGLGVYGLQGLEAEEPELLHRFQDHMGIWD